jgi:poly(3-hydroxybutyrate) depolymerase
MYKFLILTFINIAVFAQNPYNGNANLSSGGLNRTFNFHLPNTSPDCNLPLLIVYHGDGGTGAGIQSYAGFDALANSQNFIVVYPDATTIWGTKQWNKYADNVAGFAPSGETNAADDVQFTADLIDYFANRYGTNRNRVYATGHSGGGFMCYFLSMALSNKIAAIAPVAASVWGEDNYVNAYFGSSTIKTPVYHVHGTSDGTVPFPISNYPTVPNWVWPESSYGSLNCGTSTYTTSVHNANVDKLTFCSTNKKVVLMALKGWGHGWASTASGNFDTPQEIWNFMSPFALTTFSTPNFATAPTLSPNGTTISVGQSVSISANGCPTATTPVWSNGQRANSISVSPATTTTYTAKCFECSGSALGSATITVQTGNVTPIIDNHFKIDQFGYQPTAQKICVISNPITGYNAAGQAFTPSATLEVRNEEDNSVVFSGNAIAWNAGATHTQSGDKAWWFDFSALTTVGTYYVFDVAQNKRSYSFEIRADVYKEVLKHALRVFYYQRCGTPKPPTFGGTKWHDDAACHTHSQQDTDCRLVSNTNVSTSKNLLGGWHDAGDYNKYTNFTYAPMHDLLYAYQEKPSIWTDDFGLPESGNAIPDILDETKWELDWLLKMQNADGSVLSKLSVTNFAATSPPSADLAFRRYGAASTSATLTAASVFAHAAIIYKAIPSLLAYGNQLQTAAINAYTWAVANPNVVFSNAGFSSANPEVAAYDYQTALKLSAASYLFALTNDAQYKTFIDNNYANAHLIQWSFAYPFESSYQDALLFHSATVGATLATANAIKNNYSNSIATTNENLPSFTTNLDAYRAYLKDGDYTWGSNTTKGRKGSMYWSMNKYGLNAANATNYQNATAGYVHYFHGVNPIGKVYLSNMYQADADSSMNEIYHAWFGNGTVYDNALNSSNGPPSGYVVGGANPTFQPDASFGGTISPPQNNPIQKSYKDWNTSFPENSWELSEPGIYTQAAYVRLVSKLVDNVPCPNKLKLTIPITANIKNEVGQTIKGSTLIKIGTDVKFDAGKSILLEKGFEAPAGSVFKAYIDGCGNQ